MSAGIIAILIESDAEIRRQERVHVTSNTPKCRDYNRLEIKGAGIVGPNAPSTDKRVYEFVFVDNSLEVIGVSLGEVILGLERLTTLSLSARVITDLMKGGLSR